MPEHDRPDGALLDRLDAYWAARLGCDIDDLRGARLVVVPHGAALAGYQGAFALLREASCIVSVPASEGARVKEALRALAPADVEARDALAHIFAPRVAALIGPAWLGYTETGGPLTIDQMGARRLTTHDVAALRALALACDPTEWQHSSIEFAHDALFGCFRGAALVAAGTCSRRDGTIRDVGIITHPAWRGRGCGRGVVAAMTAFGVADGCVMQYRTLCANTPSMGIARSLGYQGYARTIAVRLLDRRHESWLTGGAPASGATSTPGHALDHMGECQRRNTGGQAPTGTIQPCVSGIRAY